MKFSGIVDSKLSVGRWHFLFNCPYALCSYVYLAVLLSCSTGSKGHVNHVINSVHAFRHSAMHLSSLNLRASDNAKEIGVCWCQILMRCQMKIAETLWGTEGRKYVSLHLRRWNPGEWKLQEPQWRKSFNLLSEHQGGLDSSHKPMKNCKTQILFEGLFRKTTMLGSHRYIAW